MIEAIMFFALGFLAASLIALVLLSAVWHRAVRLTTRRIEGAIPVSMAEIQADKDQLRAEFAMSTRRLETSVEQLKLKTTEQLAEIGRKSETIRLLRAEVEEKAAAVAALEAQERTMRERLHNTEEELSARAKALHEAEVELSAKITELDQLARTLTDRTAEADSRRVEIVALETQCGTLKGRVSELEREVATTEERLMEERGNVDKTSRALAEQRAKAEDLANRLAELELRLAEGRAETEGLSRTIAALEAEVRRQTELAEERDRKLAAAHAEIERLRAEAQVEAARHRDEAIALQRETEAAARSYAKTIESLKAEKAMLEGAMVQLRDDRARLQQEVAQLKHEAEVAWSNERVESALLRERINDVAAEVTRLAANIEGTGSPIERILSEAQASAPAPRQNGPDLRLAGETEPAEAGRPLSLAERIRALQLKSGRR